MGAFRRTGPGRVVLTSRLYCVTTMIEKFPRRREAVWLGLISNRNG
jgi:hypothetical protein